MRLSRSAGQCMFTAAPHTCVLGCAKTVLCSSLRLRWSQAETTGLGRGPDANVASCLHACSRIKQSIAAVQMRALRTAASSVDRDKRTALLMDALMLWAEKQGAWQGVTALPLDAAEEQVPTHSHTLTS